MSRLSSNFMTFSILIFLVGGCSTDWHKGQPYFKTIQTELQVENDLGSKVYVNNKYIGITPLKLPLEYKQQVDKEVRDVSLWQTNPGTSLLLSIVSLGLYIPFSAIPVETQSQYNPQAVFEDNMFSVRIDTVGYEEWQRDVALKGEPTIIIKPALKKIIDEQNIQGE